MVPRLGFGTASILGRHGRAKSQEAIRTALDAGVRHFDTARSYGWGEAEAVLGAALQTVPRDSVVIVSKCGIVPIKRTRALAFLKSAARWLMKATPGLSKTLRRAAATSAFQPTRSYDLEILDRSVRTSLDQLRTDYLDVLLLHNFEVGAAGIEAVVDWMRDLQQSGIIRRYGFAIGGRLVESLDWLDTKSLREGAIIQAPLSAELLALPDRFSDQEIMVHSVFRRDDPALATISSDLGAIASLLSSKMRCVAIVCSMFSRGHIIANAAALRP